MELEHAIERAVDAVKAFDGRDFAIETDWLDDECFVINFKRWEAFENRETALQYALPLLFSLGKTAEELLNEDESRPNEKEWVLYSEENYWKDGEPYEVEEDDEWDTVQVCLYLDEK